MSVHKCCIAMLAVALVSVLVVFVDPSNGAVIEADLVPGSGDGLITRDLDNGLDWLDLDQSTDLSFDFVSTQFGPGGQFEGFRHATNQEVNELFASAGIPDIGWTGSTSGNLVPCLNLQDLWGVTYPAGDVVTWAITGEATLEPPLHDLAGIHSSQYWGKASAGCPIPQSYGGFGSIPGPYVGHALVRSAVNVVPEPSSLVTFSGLLGMGLLGGWWRRRRKR